MEPVGSGTLEPGGTVGGTVAGVASGDAANTWPAAAGEQHMQIHLEIRADDLLAAQEHALACGATLASVQPQDDVRVMFDPEGHPFCLWVEEAPGN